MDDLIKLVKTFRLMSQNTAERVRLADAIFTLLEPEMRRFVYALLPDPAAGDVAQQTLKDIAVAIIKFKGNSKEEFFSFCNLIARRRVYDYIRKKKNDRLVPMPEEELWQRVDSTVRFEPLSAADRIDLKDAIIMLTKAKPECFDMLWKHYVIGLEHGEIGEEENLQPDAVRMRIKRCLEFAQGLVN